MIDIEKYDAFLFDLYGTLIDLRTDEWAPKTWKKWLKWMDERRIKHPDMITFRREFFKMDREFRKIALAEGQFEVPEIDVTKIYEILFAKYGNKLSKEAILEASWEFRKASTQYIKLFPGTKEYLKSLKDKGKTVIILSNAQASYTEPEIKMFELDKMVDDYFMSSDYKCMKPDAMFFGLAIDKYKLDKSRTIMIGDSMANDVEGAIKAGIAGFLINRGDLFLRK